MATKMLIDASHSEETRVAVVGDERLEEFDFDAKVRGFRESRFFRFEPSNCASILRIDISVFSFNNFNMKLLPINPRPPVTSNFI